MVQIEELGKVIAQIIFNRNANAARKKSGVNTNGLQFTQTGSGFPDDHISRRDSPFSGQ